MKGNEWISTVESLKQANKEKDEFIASLMEDLAACESEKRSFRKRVEGFVRAEHNRLVREVKR